MTSDQGVATSGAGVPAVGAGTEVVLDQRVVEWLGAGALNLFGLPMSGKDTQGERLAAALGAQLLSSGALIRASGLGAAEAAAGHLSPTEVFREEILPRLVAQITPGRPVVLSSVGRWHGEEAPLMEQLTQAGHPLRAVIFLKITEVEAWRRWQAAQWGGREMAGRVAAEAAAGGVETGANAPDPATASRRADDLSPQVFARRLAEFRAKTQPVLDFYAGQGLLIEVDGVGSREDIFARIAQALAESTTN